MRTTKIVHILPRNTVPQNWNPDFSKVGSLFTNRICLSSKVSNPGNETTKMKTIRENSVLSGLEWSFSITNSNPTV